ncbi:hypothetical protein NMG60_11027430 [Bertholletia excelsa]
MPDSALSFRLSSVFSTDTEAQRLQSSLQHPFIMQSVRGNAANHANNQISS